MEDLEGDSAILPGAAVLVETAGPRVYRRGVVSVVGAEDITVSFSTGEEQCARMSVWPANDFTHFAEDATTLLHLSEATLLENVPDDADASREEAFGPLACLCSVRDAEEGFARLDDSPFGLQAGVFSDDVQVLLRAHERLEVGGIIHDDVPTWRVDEMPYGGVKQSGLGREGLRDSIREMTEPRLLVLRQR